ncbi:transposase family protein [Calothrix sp. UHCC 0171]|uniref:transposase family protein n=1 Tax=Calothrix sp. UHCC 0171 TaxID=3110245 RepID=UPI002B21FD81|nr:transposase family protein [Calothrix sp. UHCC 0171]MEA5574443.1 transposase family protein [Calothrix sp. UHCC 0171]
MISAFDYIQKHPLRSKQLLGISYEQFINLVNAAKKVHEDEQQKLEQSKIRIHRRGGGRKEILSIPEQVCLCIFYLRQIPTFEVLGMLFGISKTLSNDTLHYWRKILRKILPASLLEQVEGKEGDLMIVQELLTQFKLLVDRLEQPIDRPSDNKKQRKFFSGKKRQHTRKSQVVSLPDAEDIVDIQVGFPGPTADINLFREQQKRFDENQEFEGG